MSQYPLCPWAEAERRGITVHQVDLHGLSGLNAQGKTIFLARNQTQRDLDSTLWHELGHDARGETHIATDRKCKAERAADLYAAEHMIDPVKLEELAVLYPNDPGRIAYELGVADWVLSAWIMAHPLDLHGFEDAA